MAESRKIYDYSSDRENADYRAQEINETEQRISELSAELELIIASYHNETGHEKRLNLEVKIVKLQNTIKEMINYRKSSITDYDRSIARHELLRKTLLRWNPKNDLKN